VNPTRDHGNEVFDIFMVFLGKWDYERTSHQDDGGYPCLPLSQLKQQAAAEGRSIRELILLGLRVTLLEGKRSRTTRVQFPLIVSDGPKVDLTNEQIDEHVEFP